ncbi:hypothetical protein BDP27DRAFT_1374978 [Rhodocollybia butyracea]|uniref:Uncharacterized protein n=1 Tax=Rhodocollybia butyracea TaxID=206335 RepID=A0A9P5P501_9AGAR|nr:hypothetical protein BDP27DRAFT_1374978 [Rhodocollybia butyracea]
MSVEIKSYSLRDYVVAAGKLDNLNDDIGFIQFMLTGRTTDSKGQAIQAFVDVNKNRIGANQDISMARDFDSLIGISQNLLVSTPLSVYPVPIPAAALTSSIHLRWPVVQDDGEIIQDPNLQLAAWLTRGQIHICFPNLATREGGQQLKPLTLDQLRQFYEVGLRPTIAELLPEDVSDWAPTYQAELFRAKKSSGHMGYQLKMIPGTAQSRVVEEVLQIHSKDVVWITSLGSSKYSRDIVSHLLGVSGCQIEPGVRAAGAFEVVYFQLYSTDKALTYNPEGNHHGKFMSISEAMGVKQPAPFITGLQKLFVEAMDMNTLNARIENVCWGFDGQYGVLQELLSTPVRSNKQAPHEASRGLSRVSGSANGKGYPDTAYTPPKSFKYLFKGTVGDIEYWFHPVGIIPRGVQPVRQVVTNKTHRTRTFVESDTDPRDVNLFNLGSKGLSLPLPLVDDGSDMEVDNEQTNTSPDIDFKVYHIYRQFLVDMALKSSTTKQGGGPSYMKLNKEEQVRVMEDLYNNLKLSDMWNEVFWKVGTPASREQVFRHLFPPKGHKASPKAQNYPTSNTTGLEDSMCYC